MVAMPLIDLRSILIARGNFRKGIRRPGLLCIVRCLAAILFSVSWAFTLVVSRFHQIIAELHNPMKVCRQ